jgi:quercetin dioxygenase-like cupin family protein
VGYRSVDVADVEAFRGQFRKVRQALGVRGFGINQVELGPGAEGREHSEDGSGQEEVYLAISGGGTLHVDGEEVELRPGRYVLVEAGSTRLPVAGPDGLVFIVVGGIPDAPFAPNPGL